MPFQFLNTEIPGVIEIVPRMFPGNRGFFLKTIRNPTSLQME